MLTPHRPARVPVWILALTMLAAFGIVLPVTPSAAAAQDIVEPGPQTDWRYQGSGFVLTGSLIRDLSPTPGLPVPPEYTTYGQFTFLMLLQPGSTTTLSGFGVLDTSLPYYAASGTPNYISDPLPIFFSGSPVNLTVIADITVNGVAQQVELPMFATGESISTVPEPATVALLGGGLALLGAGGVARRRRVGG